MELIINRPALRDLQDIYDWYEEQQAGLGEDFLGELDVLINYLIHFPYSYKLFYKRLRKVSLERFPYLVYYQVDGDRIFIQRIAHAHRSKRRLKL